MRVLIISVDALEDWNIVHGTEFNHCDLTDEQFQEVVDNHDGWELDSVEDLVSEMNADGPYAPCPDHHYIRLVKEPKEDFVAVSVCRNDLTQAGFDASGIDDDKMQEFAEKLGDALEEFSWGESVIEAAEKTGIPRKDKQTQ